MKNAHHWNGLKLALWALCWIAAIGCRPSPQKSAASASSNAPQSQAASAGSARTPRAVRVFTVKKRPIDRTLSVLGTLSARQQVVLSAKVPGRIKSIHVDLGSKVNAGELLAQIEPRDYELKLQQSEAALAQARARVGLPPHGTSDQIDPAQTGSVKEAAAVLAEAKANRDRILDLSKSGILSQSELEAAARAFAVASNRHQLALEEIQHRVALLAESRAQLEIARQELADTRVLAPFSGSVQVRHANLGQFLRSGDSVVTLVEMDPLRLRMEIPETEAGRIALDQPVSFQFSGDSKVRSSTLSRISPAYDEKNRILIVEADIPNDGALHPGEFVQAKITVRKDTPALVVPPKSLRIFAGLQKVVLIQNKTAVEREVGVGVTHPDWIEITSGLKEGDSVVIEPGNLRTGDPVDPRDT